MIPLNDKILDLALPRESEIEEEERAFMQSLVSPLDILPLDILNEASIEVRENEASSEITESKMSTEITDSTSPNNEEDIDVYRLTLQKFHELALEKGSVKNIATKTSKFNEIAIRENFLKLKQRYPNLKTIDLQDFFSPAKMALIKEALRESYSDYYLITNKMEIFKNRFTLAELIQQYREVYEELSKTEKNIKKLHYAVDTIFAKKYDFLRYDSYRFFINQCLGRDFFVFLEKPMQQIHKSFYDKMHDFTLQKIGSIQKLESSSLPKKNEMSADQQSETKPEHSSKRRRISETLPQYQKSILTEEKTSSSMSSVENSSRIPVSSSDNSIYDEIILLDEILDNSSKKESKKTRKG